MQREKIFLPPHQKFILQICEKWQTAQTEKPPNITKLVDFRQQFLVNLHVHIDTASQTWQAAKWISSFDTMYHSWNKKKKNIKTENKVMA